MRKLTLSSWGVCWLGTARREHRHRVVCVVHSTILLLLLHGGILLVIWRLLLLARESRLLMHHAYCVIILIVTKLGTSILAIKVARCARCRTISSTEFAEQKRGYLGLILCRIYCGSWWA